MTPEETVTISHSLILAIKELGEIAECIVKEDTRPDHWKNELGDLCGLAIVPMLDAARMSFEEACVIGVRRKLEKTNDRMLSSNISLRSDRLKL